MELVVFAAMLGAALGIAAGGLWWSGSVLMGFPPMGEEQFGALVLSGSILLPLLFLAVLAWGEFTD